MTIKPEIRNVKINTVYGEEFELIVLPNSILATEEIRKKYIDELTKKKKERIENETDDKLIEILKSQKRPKSDMVDEILVSKDGDFQIEAEDMVDEDRPNRKEVIDDKKKIFAKEEKTKLMKKTIDEIREIYVDLKLNMSDNLEILQNTYDTALLYCVRLADNPRKRIFETIEQLKEDIDSETKDNLIAEHIRVNTERNDKDSKN